MGKAFAALNWSMVGTVDNLHIVAGNALKASTRQRRGVGGRWRRFWRRVRGRSSPMTETVKPNAEAVRTAHVAQLHVALRSAGCVLIKQ